VRVYFAAPLFNANERLFNAHVVAALERFCSVFLPQRDGMLLAEMIERGVDPVVAGQRIYEQDCAAIRSADCIVALLDGGYVDEGVAFEVGFGKALGKICVALQTDVRRCLPSGNNPMIEGALDATFASVDLLLGWAREHTRRIA
jgi:nucleoside 2-deoxyribosyltransferase